MSAATLTTTTPPTLDPARAGIRPTASAPCPGGLVAALGENGMRCVVDGPSSPPISEEHRSW